VRSALAIEPHLDRELKEEILTPTKLYWPLVKKLKETQLENILGLAHITGGGFFNIPRMNEEMGYIINNYPDENFRPKFMTAILNRLNFLTPIKKVEAYKTFNMGIGFVIACRDPKLLMNQLDLLGEKFIVLGFVTDQEKGLVLTE
jgi:phosphoribosylformylglycinamidine cyclo-ligase